MTTRNKERIREIILDRIERISRGVNYKRVIFDFVLFEFRLSSSERVLDVIPREVFRLHDVINSADEKFYQVYENWKNGWGIQFDGNRASKLQIING